MADGDTLTQHDVIRQLVGHHDQLDDARKQLQSSPAYLKKREAEVAKLAATLDEARMALKKYRAETDGKELEVKTNDRKLVDLKVKLHQTKTTAEYGAIQNEMRGVSDRNGALEEEILGRLDETESRTAALAEQDGQVAKAKADLEKLRQQVAYTIDKMTRRVAGTTEEIGKTSVRLEPELKQLYERYLKAKGVTGFARCNSTGICQNCYVEQSPQNVMELKNGAVMKCRSCGMLLFLDDTPPPGDDDE